MALLDLRLERVLLQAELDLYKKQAVAAIYTQDLRTKVRVAAAQVVEWVMDSPRLHKSVVRVTLEAAALAVLRIMRELRELNLEPLVRVAVAVVEILITSAASAELMVVVVAAVVKAERAAQVDRE